MKSFLLLSVSLLLLCVQSRGQNSAVISDTTFLQPVEVTAIRAAEKSPLAKTNLSKEQIRKNNIGQDLPFILNQVPSVVVSADAGNGIGYTGIRIRGSDASRINVTLNGIPYNDAESQGTFLVNIPDIASSAGSIQVQRGVGTSTNGAGAFGGSINVSTNEVNTEKSMEFNSTAGSYHSFKNTLMYNSGILGKHITINSRLSNIRSDGYIDRAGSRLQSFYSSVAYVARKKSLRLNIFSGKEKTYQAWYGIDETTIKTNRRYNSAGTEKDGEPYTNETDNYAQTHYQFFYNQLLHKSWKMNAAFFLTKGKGFYEQYKAAASLADYGLPDYNTGSVTITETDLIRRLWLNNNFYGSIFSLQYNKSATQVILGGSVNQYQGKHYGEIIWAKEQLAIPVNHRYYSNDADKKDGAVYIKWTEKINKHWQSFADVQIRTLKYSINGFRNNPLLKLYNSYTFLNPKAGFTYSWKKNQAYISYGRAAKEPNRDDFENNNTLLAKPEKLDDFETGIEIKHKKSSWAAHLYYMKYTDQLVLTGKINDVGAYTRTNIPESYRAGLELEGTIEIIKWFSAAANITLSKNKIKHFTEYLDDYDNGGQQTKFYNNPDIAFSPAVTGAYTLTFLPLKNTELTLSGKYVSRQYLDNTTQKSRSLREFYVQDVRLNYHYKKTALIYMQLLNLFSKKYEPNGYTFSYIYAGRQTTENFYFPMAPLNLIMGINVKL